MEVITMKKIGIIGAGKVGVSIGRYFSEVCPGRYRLAGFYSKSDKSSLFASKFTDSSQFLSLNEVINNSDILIIATPDDKIKEIWCELSKYDIKNKIICHCSGSLSSEVFFDISSKSAYGCSMHPLLAINSKENSYKDLNDAFFTLEGDSEAVEAFSDLLEKKGNKFKILKGRNKTKYHLSSVFLSNLVIALGKISVDLLGEYGFSEEEALAALSSLSRKNIDNMMNLGLEKALTGPVERNDIKTVENHRKSVEGVNKDEVYRLLSLELVEIAQKKHNERNYEPMKDILGRRSLDNKAK